MNNKNLLIVLLVVIGVISFVSVEGFIKPNIREKEEQYRVHQRNPLTHDFASVLSYKNKYMGNISNLGNLNNNLPLGFIQKTFELDSKNLSATINYADSTENLEEQLIKQAILYNSTANFVLIDNLKTLQINLEGASYTVTRSHVEKWFGEELLATLQNHELWKSSVQSKLADENYVNSFFQQVFLILPTPT